MFKCNLRSCFVNFAFLLGSTIFTIQYDASELKVLLAYDSETARFGQQARMTARLNAFRQTLLEAGLISQANSLVSATPSPVPTVCSAEDNSTTSDETLDCVIDDLQSLRDSLSADLVIAGFWILSDAWSDGNTADEGLAHAPNLALPLPFGDISIDHADSAFAIVRINNPANYGTVIFNHEIGHLLYLEHQTSESSWNNSPVALNHAYESPTGKRTNVWTPPPSVNYGYSTAGDFFGNTQEIRGNTQTSDSELVLQFDSWDIVSAYRPILPPPPSCNVTTVTNICVGSSAISAVTAKLPGYDVLHSIYEVAWNGSNNFSAFYSGPLICPSISTNAVGTGDPGIPFVGEAVIRATLDTAYGSSECYHFIVPIFCGPDDPREIW